jgi:hypothetical protein
MGDREEMDVATDPTPIGWHVQSWVEYAGTHWGFVAGLLAAVTAPGIALKRWMRRSSRGLEDHGRVLKSHCDRMNTIENRCEDHQEVLDGLGQKVGEIQTVISGIDERTKMTYDLLKTRSRSR